MFQFLTHVKFSRSIAAILEMPQYVAYQKNVGYGLFTLSTKSHTFSRYRTITPLSGTITLGLPLHFFSLETTVIRFPIQRQPWNIFIFFGKKNNMVFSLILLTYSIKHIIGLQTTLIKESHISTVSLRWFFFWWFELWYVIYIRPLKGVLHPRPVFGPFLHFSQKLQHIGNK